MNLNTYREELVDEITKLEGFFDEYEKENDVDMCRYVRGMVNGLLKALELFDKVER
jgi:hypothetical protein